MNLEIACWKMDSWLARSDLPFQLRNSNISWLLFEVGSQPSESYLIIYKSEINLSTIITKIIITGVTVSIPDL